MSILKCMQDADVPLTISNLVKEEEALGLNAYHAATAFEDCVEKGWIETQGDKIILKNVNTP